MKKQPTKARKNLIHPKLVALHPRQMETNCGGVELVYSDPHFSKSPCDCCGNKKAGDRYECEVVIKSDIHPLCFDFVNVCPDCVVTWQ